MNILTLIDNVPDAAIALWVVANVFPYISAWVTRNPGWWTGVVTLLLSVLGGVVSEFSIRGDDFDWKKFLGESAVAFLVAYFHQAGLLRNTAKADALHRKGPQLGDAADDDKLHPVAAA